MIKLVWPPCGLVSAVRTVWLIAHAPDAATMFTCVLHLHSRYTNPSFGLPRFYLISSLQKNLSTFQSGNIFRTPCGNVCIYIWSINVCMHVVWKYLCMFLCTRCTLSLYEYVYVWLHVCMWIKKCIKVYIYTAFLLSPPCTPSSQRNPPIPI